jgi:CHAT domain-containing protein
MADPLYNQQANLAASQLPQRSIEDIVELFNSKSFPRLEATQASPKQINDNPLLRSGLVLARVASRPSQAKSENDGVFTAYETTFLDLVGTKLVVLSACDTGVGNITTGEGIYGLRRALVLAGSESQLISL